MVSIDYKDERGNSLVHCALLEEEFDVSELEFFFEHGIVLTRNYSGQSVLHFAVKYHFSIMEVTYMLLKHGAKVTEMDNKGSSVLHEALKNSSVTLEVIEKLLKLGAPPDRRDVTGKPPLAYCYDSSLELEEKLAAEKMIIHYSVVTKVNELNLNLQNLDENRSECLGDSILCLDFLPDCRKLNEFSNIRDSCITEISKMERVRFDAGNEYSLLDCLSLCMKDELSYDLTEENIKTILDELRRYEYPNFRDYILSALEEYDFEFLVEKKKLYINKSNSSETIILSSNCLKKICYFLSKRDVINLLLV